MCSDGTVCCPCWPPQKGATWKEGGVKVARYLSRWNGRPASDIFIMVGFVSSLVFYLHSHIAVRSIFHLYLFVGAEGEERVGGDVIT